MTASEKGGEGEIDRLEDHPYANDAQIAAGPAENVGMDSHPPEDLTTAEKQDQTDRQTKHKIGRQRHGVGLIDLFGIPGPDVLGNEDHGGGAHHGKDQQHQIGDLIGVSDGAHSGGVTPAHHDLIGVAHQHLEQKLDKNRPAQAQNMACIFFHRLSLSGPSGVILHIEPL